MEENKQWPDSFKVPRKKQDYMDRLWYAKNYFHRTKDSIDKIDKMKRKFSGAVNEKDMTYIRNTYVRKARVQYHDYRAGYRMIMQLAGEWLKRPINATVYAVNSGAITTTSEAAAIHVGLHYAKEEVNYMRENNYGDPFDGMESAFDGENLDSLTDKLNSKQNRTMAMQFILNDFIKKGGARDLLYSNYLDNIIGASCFCKITLGSNGKVNYRAIDNRRVRFVEMEGEHFIENSPFIIEERPMTFAQIIEDYPELLNPDRKEDFDKLKAWMGTNNGGTYDSIGQQHYETSLDENLLKAYCIQFKINVPKVQKQGYNKKGEKEIKDLSTEYFLDKKGSLINGQKNGKFNLDIRYKRMVYEATLIGPDILVGCGPAKNQIHNPKDPYQCSYDYTGLLFNTVMGKRTSIQELLIKLEEEYNVGRMMFNREIAKFKGSITGYNTAFLPRVNGQPVSKEVIITGAINDGLLEYNSAADGNYSGETLDPKSLFSNIDLGLSKSLDILVRHLYDIENLMMRVVGFNPERMGDTPANATVTNATNNLINSQSSTAPLDYFFDRYTDKVLAKYVEKKKISLAFYQKHEGDILLGSELMGMIREDDDWSDDYYGVYTADSRREDAVRQRMSMRGETAVANGEIRVADLMEAEIAETLQEGIAILKRGAEIQDAIKKRSEDAKNQTAKDINERNIQAMEQQDDKNKKHEIGAEMVKGAMRKNENAQQAMADYAITQADNAGKLALEDKKQNLENPSL